jgi:hypothetical protein
MPAMPDRDVLDLVMHDHMVAVDIVVADNGVGLRDAGYRESRHGRQCQYLQIHDQILS